MEMNYNYKNPNELLDVLHKLIDKKDWKKITITHNKETIDLEIQL